MKVSDCVLAGLVFFLSFSATDASALTVNLSLTTDFRDGSCMVALYDADMSTDQVYDGAGLYVWIIFKTAAGAETTIETNMTFDSLDSDEDLGNTTEICPRQFNRGDKLICRAKGEATKYGVTYTNTTERILKQG